MLCELHFERCSCIERARDRVHHSVHCIFTFSQSNGCRLHHVFLSNTIFRVVAHRRIVCHTIQHGNDFRFHFDFKLYGKDRVKTCIEKDRTNSMAFIYFSTALSVCWLQRRPNAFNFNKTFTDLFPFESTYQHPRIHVAMPEKIVSF